MPGGKTADDKLLQHRIISDSDGTDLYLLKRASGPAGRLRASVNLTALARPGESGERSGKRERGIGYCRDVDEPVVQKSQSSAFPSPWMWSLACHGETNPVLPDPPRAFANTANFPGVSLIWNSARPFDDVFTRSPVPSVKRYCTFLPKIPEDGTWLARGRDNPAKQPHKPGYSLFEA